MLPDLSVETSSWDNRAHRVQSGIRGRGRHGPGAAHQHRRARTCRAARARWHLDQAGVPYQLESGTSVYFRDPDGTRLELIADPLGEMYGSAVL